VRRFIDPEFAGRRRRVLSSILERKPDQWLVSKRFFLAAASTWLGDQDWTIMHMLSQALDPAYGAEGIFFEYATNFEFSISMKSDQRFLQRLRLFRRLKHVTVWTESASPFATGQSQTGTHRLSRADLQISCKPRRLRPSVGCEAITSGFPRSGLLFIIPRWDPGHSLPTSSTWNLWYGRLSSRRLSRSRAQDACRYTLGLRSTTRS